MFCDVEKAALGGLYAVLCYDGGPGGETGPEPAGVILAEWEDGPDANQTARSALWYQNGSGSVYAYCEGLIKPPPAHRSNVRGVWYVH